MRMLKSIGVVLLAMCGSCLHAAETKPPVIEEFESFGAKVGLRITFPSGDAGKRGAIVLFHGGGWSEGDASWMDPMAEQFAALGLVAVSVDYRLSHDTVTPFDAVADARNAIRWVRRHSSRLDVDSEKIAALGTSSGGHLAASTATFNEPWGSDVSSVPNALVLRSPAVSVEASDWFRKLVGGAAQAAALSPTLHIHANMPPTIILQGAEDNITPASAAKEFCQRMLKAGNVCELKLYQKVGHLFTHNLQNQEIPDYGAIDKEVSKDAANAAIAFLRQHGFFST